MVLSLVRQVSCYFSSVAWQHQQTFIRLSCKKTRLDCVLTCFSRSSRYNVTWPSDGALVCAREAVKVRVPGARVVQRFYCAVFWLSSIWFSYFVMNILIMFKLDLSWSNTVGRQVLREWIIFPVHVVVVCNHATFISVFFCTRNIKFLCMCIWTYVSLCVNMYVWVTDIWQIYLEFEILRQLI